MTQYPIYVTRDPYRGADKRKQEKRARYNADATRLETCINEVLLKQTSAVQVYLWNEFSEQTGLFFERISDLGYSIDGGSNGFTAWRHDLTYEQAMAANEAAVAGHAPTKS